MEMTEQNKHKFEEIDKKDMSHAKKMRKWSWPRLPMQMISNRRL